MNHGYCKNCWWWEYWVSIDRLKKPQFGKCYMQKGKNEPYIPTAEDGYCPDYCNRKKEEKKSGTLENWILKEQLAHTKFIVELPETPEENV